MRHPQLLSLSAFLLVPRVSSIKKRVNATPAHRAGITFATRDNIAMPCTACAGRQGVCGWQARTQKVLTSLVGSPPEQLGAAAFLCLDPAVQHNREALPVDGGWVARRREMEGWKSDD